MFKTFVHLSFPAKRRGFVSFTSALGSAMVSLGLLDFALSLLVF